MPVDIHNPRKDPNVGTVVVPLSHQGGVEPKPGLLDCSSPGGEGAILSRYRIMETKVLSLSCSRGTVPMVLGRAETTFTL
ncbi:hypothetical protein GCM10025772_00840 [Ferrimonas gelatinilytica]|uniref:Uncharacterized protein n=1 Tax=Ferrimonas gelatinilytica TaxID=1255257 RepID=A0ABP9RS30_9GAMM